MLGYYFVSPTSPNLGMMKCVDFGEVKLGGSKIMKYAIVESGGKQYKAIEGEIIEVDLLPIEAGNTLNLDQVLLVANDGHVSVGRPTLAGTVVKTTVVSHIRGRKVLVFKYKTRVRYRRKQGHRQQYTRLQINEIVTGA
jgi:large subunit ribosomal protein L21